MEGVRCLLGRSAGLPVASVLHKGNAIAAVLIKCTYEKGLTHASDEHVLFIVYGNNTASKDCKVTIITSLANTHEGMWKILEGVYLHSCR